MRSTANTSDRRINHRAEIDVLLNRFVNGYPYMCRAKDISRSGMRLSTFLEPDKQPRFMGLQFQLPGGTEVITASGEAVFRDRDRGEVGVRFTSLAPAAVVTIDRYLAGDRARRYIDSGE